MLTNKIREILAQRDKQTIVFSNVPLSPAAVLLPFYEKEDKYHILFTKRAEKMEHHGGQISFPGGASHVQDRNLMDTALRETSEEIGVHPQDVEILGELDNVGTITSNFLITPFVGIIPYPYDFVVNEDEIQQLIEVPLSALIDFTNRREETHFINGTEYSESIFDYNSHVIWGATALIMKQFLDMLISNCPECLK